MTGFESIAQHDKQHCGKVPMPTQAKQYPLHCFYLNFSPFQKKKVREKTKKKTAQLTDSLDDCLTIEMCKLPNALKVQQLNTG